MKSWFVRGLVWSLALVATFAFTFAATTTSGPVVAIPTWVPFAAVALVFVGSSVLRRSLLEQPDV